MLFLFPLLAEVVLLSRFELGICWREIGLFHLVGIWKSKKVTVDNTILYLLHHCFPMILWHVQLLIFGRYLRNKSMNFKYFELGWENNKICFVDLYFTFFAGSPLDRGHVCKRHLQSGVKVNVQAYNQASILRTLAAGWAEEVATGMLAPLWACSMWKASRLAFICWLHTFKSNLQFQVRVDIS